MLALLIFGMNNQLEPIGQVNYNCPNCGYAPTNLVWSEHKATVYWIPLFGMGKSYALTCDNCGFQGEVDQQLGEELHRSLSAPAAPEPPRQPAYNPLPQQPMPAGQPTTALSQPPMGAGQSTVSFGSAAPAQDNERTQHLSQEAAASLAGGYAPASIAVTSQGVICARCGADIPAGAKFCQSCGAPVAAPPPAPQAVRACENCGFVQSAGQFCNNCGTQLPPA